MHFCIRDDDTNFFTTPEDLENAYGRITDHGPVSLAAVPFCRAGNSGAVPEPYRGRGSVHKLGENKDLVHYLRQGAESGRFEVMIHGYYHDVPDRHAEFASGRGLAEQLHKGRAYLEDLLGVPVRVFVPPHNAIGRAGLQAIAREKLNLGCVAGVRSGWRLYSAATWRIWSNLRHWQRSGGVGVPWILDLGDHCEIAGNAVTPVAPLEMNLKAFDAARLVGGVFCAATHYWELKAPSRIPGDPNVGEHLRILVERAASDPKIRWVSVGDAIDCGVRMTGTLFEKTHLPLCEVRK
jgi:hypothetical protein